MLPEKSAKKWGVREAKLAIDRMDPQFQSLDGVSTDLSINFEVVNEDAQKILKEAATVAEQKKARPKLRMKCSCGHWNRVAVNKILIEQNTSEPKVKALIPMYKPLEVYKCEKCGKVIAEPKELIKIVRK